MDLIEKWIGRISAVFASVVLLAMMLQIVVDVFMRSILGAGFPATADLVSRYYMVAISFLPLAMTEISRRHIEATIFTDNLRGWKRQAVDYLGFSIGLVVFAILTWGSFGEAMIQTERGAYLEVGTTVFPTWPSYWILPISFALMALILILRLIELKTGRLRYGAPVAPQDPAEGEAR